jgi:hypothetical protein
MLYQYYYFVYQNYNQGLIATEKQKAYKDYFSFSLFYLGMSIVISHNIQKSIRHAPKKSPYQKTVGGGIAVYFWVD